MKTRVIRSKEVEPMRLPGRRMKRLITKESVGAENMTSGLVWIKPGDSIKPCHKHEHEEEAFYVIKGEGKAWIDGEIFSISAGEYVFFPKGSKHMVKNTGRKTMEALFVFAPPSDPSKYLLFPEIDFPE